VGDGVMDRRGPTVLYTTVGATNPASATFVDGTAVGLSFARDDDGLEGAEGREYPTTVDSAVADEATDGLVDDEARELRGLEPTRFCFDSDWPSHDHGSELLLLLLPVLELTAGGRTVSCRVGREMRSEGMMWEVDCN
jgi:hypothetical protein